MPTKVTDDTNSVYRLFSNVLYSLVAGYAVEYDVSQAQGSLRKESTSSNSFAFVTIRGGRHEVPESAPAQAYEMLNRLINNQPF